MKITDLQVSIEDLKKQRESLLFEIIEYRTELWQVLEQIAEQRRWKNEVKSDYFKKEIKRDSIVEQINLLNKELKKSRSIFVNITDKEQKYITDLQNKVNMLMSILEKIDWIDWQLSSKKLELDEISLQVKSENAILNSINKEKQLIEKELDKRQKQIDKKEKEIEEEKLALRERERAVRAWENKVQSLYNNLIGNE